METPETRDKYSSPQANAETCSRCGGLLLTQHYMDLLDDTGQIDITAWHCMTCGEVIDPVILKNRRSPPPNLLYGTKARKFSQRVTGTSNEKISRKVSEGSESDAEEEYLTDEPNS